MNTTPKTRNLINAEKIVSAERGTKVAGIAEITNAVRDNTNGVINGHMRVQNGTFAFEAFPGTVAHSHLGNLTGGRGTVRFQAHRDQRGKEIVLSMVKSYDIELAK